MEKKVAIKIENTEVELHLGKRGKVLVSNSDNIDTIASTLEKEYGSFTVEEVKEILHSAKEANGDYHYVRPTHLRKSMENKTNNVKEEKSMNNNTNNNNTNNNIREEVAQLINNIKSSFFNAAATVPTAITIPAQGGFMSKAWEFTKNMAHKIWDITCTGARKLFDWEGTKTGRTVLYTVDAVLSMTIVGLFTGPVGAVLGGAVLSTSLNAVINSYDSATFVRQLLKNIAIFTAIALVLYITFPYIIFTMTSLYNLGVIAVFLPAVAIFA